MWLDSEHERFRAGDVAKMPVLVRDYLIVPKPVCMRAHNDRRTLACFSLLFPCLGGLADGSLREACA